MYLHRTDAWTYRGKPYSLLAVDAARDKHAMEVEHLREADNGVMVYARDCAPFLVPWCRIDRVEYAR